jgi:Fe-S cluster assembly iron-binding protein IscA
VRIFGGAQLNGQGTVQIGFSERPLVGDDVSEAAGTRVFVAPEVTQAIDGLVLDVADDGERVGLVLRPED